MDRAMARIKDLESAHDLVNNNIHDFKRKCKSVHNQMLEALAVSDHDLDDVNLGLNRIVTSVTEIIRMLSKK